MQYRADIDGLRAVAILAVLLNHAGVSSFSGGFVGVDVFFVISGYLITRILAEDFDAKRYSIRNFYERRIRRIVPPLIAVTAFTLAVASFIYLPSDLEEVARSAVAANLFASNLLYYKTADYFAALSAYKPLLHTWSLGVEEQYYIAFPIGLALLRRYAPQFTIAAISLVWLLSFGAAAWAVTHKPYAAFYLLPFRAWELFTGSLLALGMVRAPTWRPLREGLAVLGLTLIAYSVFTLDHESTFPGVNAAGPVLGSALLILAAPGTVVGRVLTFPPMVWVGLISYSLYLWHWPIIVFLSYAGGAPLRGWSTFVAITASFVAAILSWRFIERPFRHSSRISVPAIFTTATASIVAVCAVSAVMLNANGWPSRFNPEVLKIANSAQDVSERRHACHRGQPASLNPPLVSSCRYGSDAPPRFAVFGDSHGVELSAALGEVAARSGQSFVQLTYSACPPIVSDEVVNLGCRTFVTEAMGYLLHNDAIDTVILIANFDRRNWRDNSGYRQGLRVTVAKLTQAGKQVVLVYPAPVQPGPVPSALAVRAAFGLAPDAYGVKSADFYRRNEPIWQLLDSLRSSPLVSVVRIDQQLCAHEVCATSAGAPLYFDDNHLSMAGARFVAPLFGPVFRTPTASQGPFRRKAAHVERVLSKPS